MKKNQSWISWIDFVPIGCVPLFFVLTWLAGYTWDHEAYHAYASTLRLAPMLPIVVAFIFCVSIASNASKPIPWKMFNILMAAVLFLFAIYALLVLFITSGCAPGGGSC